MSVSLGRAFVYNDHMDLCGICNVPLTGTRHTVELHPGIKQAICHYCHVEITGKIVTMTVQKAKPEEVNGL